MVEISQRELRKFGERGSTKLTEIQKDPKWMGKLEKWNDQKKKKEFELLEEWQLGKFVRPVRKVERVTIEVRLQRGDLTWVLREVARVPDGEVKPDRVRFSHPQGKVDGSDQKLGDEMKWHNAAHRELLEETGFDLHLINEKNEREFPENVSDDAGYVVRSFLSHCRNSNEENHLGGTFPGITRITETRHYLGQLIEPAGKVIDLSEPIIEEEKKDGEVINRNFFRWFPSTEGFNTDFGEDSAGIQPTHPHDLLDALKQARRVHHDENLSWKKVYEDAEQKAKKLGDEGADAEWVAERLDSERKSDTRNANDLKWGKHGEKMQSKLHLGHRQAAIVRFNKILLKQARESDKVVHPLIPYGQMSREFGLRIISDVKNIEMMKNIGEKGKGKWSKRTRNFQLDVLGKMHVDAPKPVNISVGTEPGDWKEEDAADWREIHGYVIQALKHKCEACDVKVGQPCPLKEVEVRKKGKKSWDNNWATALHDNWNKTRLPKVASDSRIDAAYLDEIKKALKKEGVKAVGWRNLQPSRKGWGSDWANGFPLVCRHRLHVVSQSLDIEKMIKMAVVPRKTQRVPKRYLSSNTVSPATLRNRIIHSLQRYLLISRKDNLNRYRIQKWNLQHVLQHPVVELFDTEKWGEMVGKDLDNRQEHGVELNIFDYSTAKRLHEGTKKHVWAIFNAQGRPASLDPGLNLDGQEQGFLPSVQVDAPLFEIFSAFAQGHPAVVIRRDYYVNKDGEKWPNRGVPDVDEKFKLEIDDCCITPGQLIQSATESGTVLMNEDILQVRCALGVLEADTFLHKVLPTLQEI